MHLHTPEKVGWGGCRKHLDREKPLISLCLSLATGKQVKKTTMEILNTIGLMLHNLWGLTLAYSGLIAGNLGTGKFRDPELGNDA